MSRQKEKAPDRRKKKGVWIWLAFFFCGGVLVTLFSRVLSTSLREQTVWVAAFNPSATANNLPDQSAIGPKGPWGILQYKSIPLENFEELYPNGVERLQPARWVFENYSQKQLADLLSSCDLTDSQRAFLLDTNHWEALTNGWAILPETTRPGGSCPMGMLMELPRSVRSRMARM